MPVIIYQFGGFKVRLNKQLAAAAIAGLITAGLIYQVMTGYVRSVPVVVAARNIPPYTGVESGMLSIAYLPPAALHPQALTDEAKALGRFTTVPVVAGEMLLEAKLSPADGAGAFLNDLAPDERAVFIPTTLARGLGGAVARGQEVDLIYVPTREHDNRPGAWTMFHRLRVLDVRSEKGRSLEEKGEGGLPAGILVAVKGEEAEKLAYCLETGNVYLALNPPSSRIEARTGGEEHGP